MLTLKEWRVGKWLVVATCDDAELANLMAMLRLMSPQVNYRVYLDETLILCMYKP